MPIDPNIAMGVQPVQIASPLDMAVKGMTLKQMMLQNQTQQRAIDEDQAVRDAYRTNTTIGPNGQMNVDQAGLTKSLVGGGQASPSKIMDVTSLVQKHGLETLKNNTQAMQDLLASVHDDASAVAAKQKALQMNLPGADHLPDQYMPSVHQQLLLATMNGEQQIKHYEWQQDQQRKIEDHQDKRDANSIQRETNSQNKNNQAQKDTVQLLESARGNPAAAQAERDLYAAQKFNTGYNLYGDPNKLNPQQSHLLTIEAAKIAGGGAPTVDDIRGLSQGTIPSALSRAAQALTNNTSAANQGAFLKALKDYNDGITKDAQSVIESKYGRIIESRKNALSPGDYKTLQEQYVNRFKNAGSAGSAPKLDHLSDDEVDALYTKMGGK